MIDRNKKIIFVMRDRYLKGVYEYDGASMHRSFHGATGIRETEGIPFYEVMENGKVIGWVPKGEIVESW